MSVIAKDHTYRRLGTTREVAAQRILIIDDDHELCLGLRDSVQAWLDRVEILVAPSAERALEILEREPVNLIITDQWLQGMSGVEFLRHTKARYPGIPSILITGRPDMDLVQEALRTTNVCTFLPKPIRLESVITAIAGLLHMHGTYFGYTRSISTQLRGLRDELRGLQEEWHPNDPHRGPLGPDAVVDGVESGRQEEPAQLRQQGGGAGMAGPS